MRPVFLPALLLTLCVRGSSAQDSVPQARFLDAASAQLGVTTDKVQLGPLEGPIALPNLGVRVLVRPAVRADGAGRKVGLVAGEDGRVVSLTLQELLALERAAAYQRHGKMAPALLSELGRVGADRPIEVAIWVQGPAPDAARAAAQAPLVAGEVTMEQASLLAGRVTETVRAEVAAVTHATAAKLRTLGLDVVRADDLAPVVFARTDLRGLALLHQDAAVLAIDFAGARYVPRLDVADGEVRADLVRATGLDGTGVTVAIVEPGNVCTTNPFLTVAETRVLGGMDPHTTGVASCVGSRHPVQGGIAPGARILAANAAGSLADSSAAISWAMGRGARVLNLSYGAADPGPGLTSFDRYLDYVARSTGALFTIACGNSGLAGGFAGDPGAGYNQLAVGNFDDRGGSAWAGEFMSATSSWRNPETGHESPQVAAPGSAIDMLSCFFPWTGYRASGTSFAAPITAGISALLIQRRPDLLAWQEALRAIVQVTAWHNIEGAAHVSDRDGCGGVDARAADLCAQRGRGLWGGYNAGVLTAGSFDAAGLFTAQMVYLTQNDLMARVCLTYDSRAGGAPSYSPDRLEADLDLEVYSPGGGLVAASRSLTSSFEIVAFPIHATGFYSIKVRKARFDGASEFYATAVSKHYDR